MSVTIHDLARLAGLNSSTISRALRNDPRVRSDTREKIHALAEKYNYIPNLNARNLADGKTRMIAFLMGSLEYQLEREAAVTLNEIFSQHGYTLMIFSYAPDLERYYADRLKKFTQKICDGAILLAPCFANQSPHVLSLLKAVRMPMVCIDRWFREFQLPVVTTDNTVAIRRLCDEAAAAGMDGAIVDFYAADTVAESRRAETEKLLRERGIPLLFPDEGDVADFIRRNKIRKPVVFANSGRLKREWVDLLPPGFITAAFDRDFIKPEHAGPMFLCVQDYRGIAEKAAQILLRQLDGGEASSVPELIPPSEIIHIS